jgi:hypothetical protein
MPDSAKIELGEEDQEDAEIQVESLINLMQEMKRIQELNKN